MSELIAKSGTKNKAWDYFGLECRADKEPPDEGKVMCLTCHLHVVGYSYITIFFIENIVIPQK